MEYNSLHKKTIEKLANLSAYKEISCNHRSGAPMPSLKNISDAVRLLRGILFPGYFDSMPIDSYRIESYLGVRLDQIADLMVEEVFNGMCSGCRDDKVNRLEKECRKIAKEITYEFIERIPRLREALVNDVKAIYVGDPAAESYEEIIYCYPAVRAICNYRIAHLLHGLEAPLIPRIITEMAHSETGIDIHPSAVIGDSFMIDHGTGVVIGATSIIGNRVRLYQGVTLGAKSFPLDPSGNPIKNLSRHPIVEDDVIIYSHATILGRVTIGARSVVGGNVWVTDSIPPESKVSQDFNDFKNITVNPRF